MVLRTRGVRILDGLKSDVLAIQVANAPAFTAAPTRVDQAYVASDGTAYFVPMARVAKRSRASETPHVFIDRREGQHFLQVHVVLVRHPNVQADATPLALGGISARLQAPGSAKTIDFPTCHELPAAEGETDVVKRVFCEAAVDPNPVTTILQSDSAAWFDLQADVHYRLAESPSGGLPPIKIDPNTIRAFSPIAARVAEVEGAAAPAATLPSRAIFTGALNVELLKHIDEIKVAVPPTPTSVPPDTPEPPPVQSARVSLTNEQHEGVGANFPPSIPANRAIYAEVASSFGIDPGAAWVETPSGPFMESPIPDQFYVLPDDYRLAFDVERATPAMFVLLVPRAGAPPTSADGAPAEPGAASSGAPATISSDYRLRCRFAIVPWFETERIEALREEIASRTGIPYPELVIGGIPKATFELSAIYESLGSDVLGDSPDAPLQVDPKGFELVLDCTNEFYNLLSRMLVAQGLEGEVGLSVPAGEGEEPRLVSRPVSLRLDQPAIDFLTTRLEPDESNPDAPLRLIVANPAMVEVEVGKVRPTLLVMDEEMPSPIKAVHAEASPQALSLSAARKTGGPTEVEVALAADEAIAGAPWGAVAVSFENVSADLDPDAILSKAHELGASTDLKSSVVVRCYQLQHPDALPESHRDVFGLELQLRRGDADPVTVFLTRDEPEVTVQVSFSLADIMAGARPEQPKFSWRRRNMAGAGTGQWSEWETIVGQQLFVSPVGL